MVGSNIWFPINVNNKITLSDNIDIIKPGYVSLNYWYEILNYRSTC